MTENALSIKDLITDMHAELLAARDARVAAGLKPIFMVEKVTIEANCVVTRTAGGKAGFGLRVFSVGIDAGGDAKREVAETHKVTIELHAVEKRQPKSAAPSATGVVWSDGAEPALGYCTDGSKMILTRGQRGKVLLNPKAHRTGNVVLAGRPRTFKKG